MRTSKIALLVLASLLIFTPVFTYILAGRASAHVLIEDSTGKTGAILHITPDDEPLATGTSGLFFEVQTKDDLSQAALHLQVTDDTGGIDQSVLMTGSGSSASGAYIFPKRGLYYLIFTINQRANGPKISPLTFKYSVRITQSVGGLDPRPSTPTWATLGLIMSVWGAAACGLVLFTRRKVIFTHSK